MTTTLPLRHRMLRNRRLTEPATLVQESPGMNNDFGEFVPGTVTETAVRVWSGPIGGDGGVTRWQIPEGDRLQDYRSFVLFYRDAAPLRTGTAQTNADVLVYRGATLLPGRRAGMARAGHHGGAGQARGGAGWVAMHKPGATINDLEAKDWCFVKITNDPYGYQDCVPAEAVTHMCFRDPNGVYGELAIAPTFQSNGASWKWDGNFDAPTLTPSIDGSGWHGWLRVGKWVKA